MNPWKNKDVNKEKAIDHLKYVNMVCARQISKSIGETIFVDDAIYTGKYDERFEALYGKRGEIVLNTKVDLIDTDTVSGLFKYINDDPYVYVGNVNITVLNFASYKNPGGMFLQGSMAQEESLCHNSDLYPILNFFDNTYYARHRVKGATNNSLYHNELLITKDVTFINYEDKYNPNICRDLRSITDITTANVITCAAPNKKAAMRYSGITAEEVYKVMDERIHLILETAVKANTDVLILGAYGCGVFGNNPIDVARIFMSYLGPNGKYSSAFTNIIFAIPPGPNFDAFASVLNEIYNR